jgi:hypothetical protein
MVPILVRFWSWFGLWLWFWFGAGWDSRSICFWILRSSAIHLLKFRNPAPVPVVSASRSEFKPGLGPLVIPNPQSPISSRFPPTPDCLSPTSNFRHLDIPTPCFRGISHRIPGPQ